MKINAHGKVWEKYKEARIYVTDKETTISFDVAMK